MRILILQNEEVLHSVGYAPQDIEAIQHFAGLRQKTGQARRKTNSQENVEKLWGWHQRLFLRDCFFIKTGEKLEKVNIQDILYIEVQMKHIFMHTKTKELAARMTLRDIIQQLPTQQFVQIHRKCIINTHHIDSINLKTNEIEIAGKVLSVSKRQRDELIERLNKV